MNIEKISKLASLALTSEEKTKFSSQMDNILEYFKVLDSVDVDSVEPLMHGGQLETAFRVDQPKPGVEANELFKIAPQHDGKAFLVTNILD